MIEHEMLTLLILELNKMADSGEYDDISIEDVHREIDKGTVLEFLKARTGDRSNFGMFLESGHYDEFRMFYRGRVLAEHLRRLRGRRAKEVGRAEQGDLPIDRVDERDRPAREGLAARHELREALRETFEEDHPMKIVRGETRGRPGRWILDFHDQAGRRRWETYRSQREAKEALSVRLEQLRKGTYHAPREIPTVQRVADAWLVAKRDRRPSTVAGNENYVSAHIGPRLGSLRLNQVTVAHVEAFREELRKTLAPRTVNKILAALTAIFDHAIKHGLTEKNPARVVDRLKLDTGEVVVLGGDAPHHGDEPTRRTGKVTPEEVPTVEEVSRLLAAAAPGRDRTFFLLAVHTGAREGELLALTWDDLDLDGRTVAIRRTVSWARTQAERREGLQGPRFYEPKTRAGRRVVELPDDVVRELRHWKLACPPSRLGLVFPTADGRPLHRRVLHKQALEPALRAASLRHFNVHSLRHFHASILIQRRTPVTEVAARLGHASPAVTMAVYAHFLREVRGEATNAVAEALAAVGG